MADASGGPEDISAEQADATIRSRQYVGLLIVVAVIGVLVSLAAWCFLEGVYQLQQELFTHLPHALGYPHGPPNWWYLLVLGVGALLVAVGISRLPGSGGHIPADGLSAGGPAGPVDLPGIVLAGFATIGFGLVLGPEPALRGGDRHAADHRRRQWGRDLVMPGLNAFREIDRCDRWSRRAVSEREPAAAVGGVHLVRVMPGSSRPVASPLSLGSAPQTMTTLEVSD